MVVVTQRQILLAQELVSRAAPRSSYGRPSAADCSPARSDSADSVSDASSIGCDEPVMPLVVKPTIAKAPVVTVAPKPAFSPADLAAVLPNIMSYLPIEALTVARQVSAEFEVAASHVAPRPLGDDRVTFVRWEPTPTKTTAHSGRFPRSTTSGHFPWRCLNCDTVTHGPRSCTTCRTPISVAACRVFLGQLRKEQTAELTSFMLRSLVPDVSVLHVESHTNPTDGRGKGCAWVYVDSVMDAIRVTEMHKRVFADADADGYEGFWYINDAVLIPQLAGMADTLASQRGRLIILPRQPMVAELPGKSMIAQVVEKMGQF